MIQEKRTADLREQGLHVFVLERQPTTEHDIQNHTAAPHVDLRTRIKSSTDDLRRGVIGTPAAGLEEVAVLDLVRESEVGNLHVQVVVEEDVLRLQVAVHDLEVMAVLNPGDDLLEETARLRLFHTPVRDDVVEELPASVLEDDDDVGGRRYDLIPGYTVRRPEAHECRRRTYSLMMCGCLRARMYSTSRCTLVFVRCFAIACFEMNFMATFCPVTVWTATARSCEAQNHAGNAGKD